METIARELGLNDLSVASLEAVQAEARLLYDTTTQTCMKGQGFEFPPGPDPNLVDTADFEGQSVEDYIDEHGWSITDSFVGSDAPRTSSRAQYVAGLNDRERDAYDIALNGNADDDSSNGGCSQFAGEFVRSEIAAYATLTDYEEQLERTIELFSTDFRIIAFHRSWSTCMTERGFFYGSPEEMRSDLLRRAQELTSPQAVQDARRYEIDAAKASNSCGVPPSAVGQPEVYEDVLTSLANRFLQENPEFGK